MKHIFVFALINLFVLTGCQTPNIVEEYNEFKNEKICKLHRYNLVLEYAFRSARETFISFVKNNDSTFKVTLESLVQRNYKSLSDNGQFQFILTENNLPAQTLSFTGSNLQVTHGSIVTQGAYGVRGHIPTITTTVNFVMTTEQLQKIISAQSVEVLFEAGDEPIRSKLSQADKDAFKQFLAKCY